MFAAFLQALLLQSREVTVTILATTDMHGNIYPYDYLTSKPAERGIAKLGTLIQTERRTAPSALLLDCGDTIQGSPLESVYQTVVATGKAPRNRPFDRSAFAADPMMTAMNYLRYDAMAVGNHEYNYGLKNLDKARSDARFPWLSANTRTVSRHGPKPFAPYIVKEVEGVKVGIIGITTPAVPTWEKQENYAGYSFDNAVASTKSAIDELRAKHKTDVIVVIAHSGVNESGAANRSHEDIVLDLVPVAGVDVIIFGHSHNQLENRMLNGVLLTQPKNWAISLSRVDIQLESTMEGGYKVRSKTSRLIPVTAKTEADPEILRLAKPYHDVTEAYLNTVVARAKADIDASESRIEDSAIIDAIQLAQMRYAKADVSFASSFNPRAAIAKGPITIRQVAALYLYDNELYAIEGTGKMVRDALENSAGYFKSCADPSCSNGSLINSAVIGYNFDMAHGVTYDIDLTRPDGDRIRNLQFRGKPLALDQKLRIAVNNYRAGGSNGYTMFKDAKVVWRSYEDIRDLIIRYYSEHELPTAPDNNWRIIPESAHRSLEQEVRRYSQPQSK
ncbi:MAG TPA: 5'-nucleotidase C-terminal domain-containing protein [Bryobacteraceae bacterium]|nr:5'-nucleotidase C-terminal domain-containing protein [Bryobacteraceae bacterium]